MLTEDAAKLRTLIANYSAARAERAQLNSLKQRSEQLHALRDRLGPLSVGYAVLKRRRIPCDGVPPLAENIGNSISKIEALIQKPGSLGANESAPLFNAITRASNSTAPQIEALILGAWGAFVEQQLGQQDISVLADWEHVPDLREVARKIRATQAKVQDLRRLVPRDDDDIERVQTFARELKGAWKEVENTPPNVLKFLREASAPTGASLLLLDEETFEWLRKRKLEGSFKVRIVSNNPYAR
jgi:hypothetical protein